VSPEITVVLAVFNCDHILERTLERLVEQDLDHGRYEVIVTDGGSTDASVEIATRFVREHQGLVRQTRTDERISLARTRNLGAELARSPLVFYLDSDLLPCSSLLSTHLRYHSKYPEESVAIIGHLESRCGGSATAWNTGTNPRAGWIARSIGGTSPAGTYR